MHTSSLSPSKAIMFLTITLLAAAPASSQGIVMERTPEAETLGAFDNSTIQFSHDPHADTILVTPRPAPAPPSGLLIVPELQLNVDAAPPQSKPPVRLLPHQE